MAVCITASKSFTSAVLKCLLCFLFIMIVSSCKFLNRGQGVKSLSVSLSTFLLRFLFFNASILVPSLPCPYFCILYPCPHPASCILLSTLFLASRLSSPPCYPSLNVPFPNPASCVLVPTFLFHHPTLFLASLSPPCFLPRFLL